MPPGLSELVVAQQALGGVGLALLRQQRTGQGQFVQVRGSGTRGEPAEGWQYRSAGGDEDACWLVFAGDGEDN